MNIAGSGSLPGGIYTESIHISGSGKINGDVSCLDLIIAGSGHIHGNIHSDGSFRTSGSAHAEGNVEAKEFAVSGSCHIDGTVSVNGCAAISGSMKCLSLTANEIQISGGCTIDGDLTAEVARIRGGVRSDGLLNAEDIEIHFSHGARFGSIGGSKIRIVPNADANKRGFLRFLFGKSRKAGDGNMEVLESIEGDEIYLEYVTAETVSGRIVTIGPGCQIGTLTYSESADISPEAEVRTIGGANVF